MRVRVKAAEMCAYPDIACARRANRSSNTCRLRHSLLNPQVIFEVLSPETEVFDRGDKFDRYRMLDSLTDYVMVASERMRVEPWSRQAGRRVALREYRSAKTGSRSRAWSALTLAEIYRR